nr:glycosyltransferase family 2 protein [Polymorphobacter sp.]
MTTTPKPRTLPPEAPEASDTGATSPRLGVILVNYKRADDTIECLESLLRSTIPLRIIVVDNGSGDGSLDTIAAWAAGQHPVVSASPDMAPQGEPWPKPVDIIRLTAAQAATTDPVGTLTLVDAGDNRGFAAGNNIGLRHLLRDRHIDHAWLLNNDTVVDAYAAAALLARLDATPGVGLCGTVVRFYWQPDIVQALNGHRFNVWTGMSKGIGARQPATRPFNPAKVAKETDFVLGASMGVSRRFIETIGLMDERYFLYFEEVDWAARNDGRFANAFAHGAIVYHKEGGSIGSSGVAGARSAMSDYWLTRSRLRFIRLHRPLLLPWHWLVTLAVAARRLLRLQPSKSAATIRALFGIDY